MSFNKSFYALFCYKFLYIFHFNISDGNFMLQWSVILVLKKKRSKVHGINDTYTNAHRKRVIQKKKKNVKNIQKRGICCHIHIQVKEISPFDTIFLFNFS